MLNVFRKHATSWLIKVALFLIVIVFIFWGGYSYRSRDATRLARVNDQYLTIGDYEKTYNQMVEMYRRQLGNSFSEEMIRMMNLKQQALNILIDRYVVSEAARNMGMVASAQEIQNKILEYPVFQKDGKFDQERYVLLLRQNRLSPEMFEHQLREDLTLENVSNFVKRQAVLTDDEIAAEFRFSNSPIQIGYVEIEPKSYIERVTVTDKVLEEFYEKNKERFKELEKRKFAMVLFKTDSHLKDVQVSADEVKQYYEENAANYHKPAEVKARNILLRVEEDAPAAQVESIKAEAEKILQEVKKKGADFAELAQKYSQDQAAAKGGDLGYFTRDRMIPAFADAAFALKAGETSELVRTPYGFHIIKVEDIRPERTIPLDEARAEIELTLKREKARDITYKEARDFGDAVYAQGDIRKAASAGKLDLVETKEWLKQTDPIPGVNVPPQVIQDLFKLNDKAVSEVLEVPEGFLLAQVEGVKEPEIPPFAQAKPQIEQAYKNEEASKLAQKAADDLLAAARKLNSLEQASKESNLEMKKSNWFTRMKPDRSLRFTGSAVNKLFQLEESKPFPDAPLDVGGRFQVVYQLIGKKAPPQEDLAKERPGIVQKLQEEKQNQLWQAWLENQRRQAKIEILKEL